MTRINGAAANHERREGSLFKTTGHHFVDFNNLVENASVTRRGAEDVMLVEWLGD
jgi:hypothetical protein